MPVEPVGSNGKVGERAQGLRFIKRLLGSNLLAAVAASCLPFS
jgi:hypothetical protein